MNKRSRDIKRLILLVYVIVIIIGLFYFYYFPVQSYEYSINNYNKYIYTIVVLLLLYSYNYISIFINDSDKNFNFNIFLILITRFILLSLPFIHGYYALYGDHLDHMSYILDIINVGKLYNNIYPITHLLSVTLILYTGTTIDIINYISPFFSVLFCLFMYLWIYRILNNNIKKIFFVTFGTVFLFKYGRTALINYEGRFSAGGLSLLFLPFILYFLSGNIDKEKSIFVVILISLPFLHPITSIIFTIYLLITLFYSNIKSYDMITNKKYNFDYVIIIGMMIILNLFSSNIFLIKLKNNIIYFLSYGQQGISYIYESINLLNYNITDFIKHLSLQIIDYYILFFIFIIIAYPNNNYKKIFKNNKLKINIITFGSLLFLYLLYFLNILPILQIIQANRFIAYSVLFIYPIYVYLLSHIHKNYLKNIYFLIIILSICSSILIFQSPESYQPNQQMSRITIQAYKWIFNYNLDSYSIGYIRTDAQNMYEYINKYIDIKNSYSNKEFWIIPDHFEYNYSQSHIIIITKRDMYIYLNLYDEMNRFNVNDFNNISSNEFLNKIYSNTDSYIYNNYMKIE